MYVNALDAQHKLPAVNEELPVPHHFIVELHYILFVTPDGKKQNKTNKQQQQKTMLGATYFTGKRWILKPLNNFHVFLAPSSIFPQKK